MGFCSKGLKNEFETAVVNELSVFKPLEFYYTWKRENMKIMHWNGDNCNENCNLGSNHKTAFYSPQMAVYPHRISIHTLLLYANIL